MELRKVSSSEIRMKDSKRLKMAFGIAAVAAVGAGIACVIICVEKSRKDKGGKSRIINIARTTKDALIDKANDIKYSAVVTAKEVSNVVDAVHKKLDNIKNDVADGSQKIVKDINDTIENVSQEFKQNN